MGAEHNMYAEGLEHRTWEEALAPNKLILESVTLNQWLNMWARLCDGAAGMNNFPIWVQIIPNIMFAVQCGKNKKGIITKDCLRHFYLNFAGVEAADLDKLTEAGFDTMTAHGDYELDLENYKLLFANFSWEEPSTDQESSFSAASITAIWTRSTKSSLSRESSARVSSQHIFPA